GPTDTGAGRGSPRPALFACPVPFAGLSCLARVRLFPSGRAAPVPPRVPLPPARVPSPACAPLPLCLPLTPRLPLTPVSRSRLRRRTAGDVRALTDTLG